MGISASNTFPPRSVEVPAGLLLPGRRGSLLFIGFAARFFYLCACAFAKHRCFVSCMLKMRTPIVKICPPTPMRLLAVVALTALLACTAQKMPHPSNQYETLVTLSEAWRSFARPQMIASVPDYTPSAMARQKRGIANFQKRLTAIDTTGWPMPKRMDWEIVQAEMKGLVFNHEVLRPWAKNPIFYAVIQMDEPDVPAREMPEIAGVLNVFEHRFPLNAASQKVFLDKLSAIPAILQQARGNLTEMTGYFGMFGVEAKAVESEQLAALAEELRPDHPELAEAATVARQAVDAFAQWLDGAWRDKPVFSGIGKAAFDRYMREVHLVPYGWEVQKSLLERELQRSLSALAMEEHRNRHLPPLKPAASLKEMQQMMKQSVSEFMGFLKREEIMTVPAYMDLAVPDVPFIEEDALDFFFHIYYRNPLPLLCHQVHWLEKQRELRNTHPIRSGALLSKIWDSRAEGLATNFEELMMHAGILDTHPRARELTWALLAFRAARGIGGLMLQAGEWTLEEAMAFGSQYTPNGFAGPESQMLRGDYALYLSQPGYGTSYVVGKAQLDKLIAERRVQLGQAFTLKAFFDDYFARGVIPASLIYREMTGF